MAKVIIKLKMNKDKWLAWQRGDFSIIDNVANSLDIPTMNVEIIEEGKITSKKKLKKVM